MATEHLDLIVDFRVIREGTKHNNIDALDLAVSDSRIQQVGSSLVHLGWHGTSLQDAEDLKEDGFNADLSGQTMGVPGSNGFGQYITPGFYLSAERETAEYYANRRVSGWGRRTSLYPDSPPAIIEVLMQRHAYDMMFTPTFVDSDPLPMEHLLYLSEELSVPSGYKIINGRRGRVDQHPLVGVMGPILGMDSMQQIYVAAIAAQSLEFGQIIRL